VAAVDALTGGLPRGALTEICGSAGSGRSSLLLAALAESTRRQEICALVDTTDSFDPASAKAAGVDLDRLLWIRCKNLRFAICDLRFAPANFERSGPLENRKANIASPLWPQMEKALQATDLLLQGGGFGLVAIDLADVPPDYARRVPLASWFRFRRVVEHTSTVLLVVEQEPYAKTCASLVLRTAAAAPAVVSTVPNKSTAPAHGQLFCGLHARMEVVRTGADVRKPVRSAREASSRFSVLSSRF
jgi:hypothetical protein